MKAPLVALVDRHYTNEHGELAEQLMRILESNESLPRCRSVLLSRLLVVSPATPATTLIDIATYLTGLREKLSNRLIARLGKPTINPYECLLAVIEETIRPLTLSSIDTRDVASCLTEGGKWVDYAKGIVPWDEKEEK